MVSSFELSRVFMSIFVSFSFKTLRLEIVKLTKKRATSGKMSFPRVNIFASTPMNVKTIAG